MMNILYDHFLSFIVDILLKIFLKDSTFAS